MFLLYRFLSATEDQTLISIIVEVTSAFGTTGLSLGITGDLSVVGKITIVCPDVYWADWNAVYIDAVRTKRNPRSGL